MFDELFVDLKILTMLNHKKRKVLVYHTRIYHTRWYTILGWYTNRQSYPDNNLGGRIRSYLLDMAANCNVSSIHPIYNNRISFDESATARKSLYTNVII